jgi:hypothetical protein
MMRNRFFLPLIAIFIPLLLFITSVHAAKLKSYQETPDFGIVPPQSAWSLYPGQTADFTVEITATASFTHTVGIEIFGFPSGTEGSISPNPVQPDASATVHITTTSYTTPGSYPLQIVGSEVISGGIPSNPITHTVQTDLTILPAGIGVSVSPSQRTVFPWRSASYTVNITATLGFNLPVSLKADSLPAGMIYSFSPVSVAPGGSTSLIVTATWTTLPGHYQFSITGTSLTYTQTVNAFVNVDSITFLPVIHKYFHPLPYQPTLNSIAGAEDGEYTLSWTEMPERFGDTYTVQEAVDSTFTSELMTICNTNQQSCYIGSHSPGTYYYRVQGSNVWGNSLWSNVQSATVLLPEAPLLNPINNNDGDGNYNVNWTGGARATEYTLQEATNNNFDGAVTISAGIYSNWSVNGKPAGTYYYRVRSEGKSGSSDWSNVQSVSVLPPDTPTLYPIDNADGNGNYTVAWSTTARADNYTLEESTSDSFAGAVTVFQGAATSWTANYLTPGKRYYRVLAAGPTGQSGWSNVQSASVLPPDTPTLYPINNPGGNGNYTVTWSSAARATSYTLQESTSNSFAGATTVFQGAATSWTANNLTPGTRYYRVLAVGPTGQSGWSNVQSTTVQSTVRVVSSSAFVPYSGSSSLYIVGEVINSTSKNVQFVRINSTLRDSSGNVVGSDYTYSDIDIIPPGNTSPFLVIFSSPLPWTSYELVVTWDTTNDSLYPLQVLNQTTYFDSLDAFHVVGEIQNQYNEQRTYVKALVTLYDQNHTVIGVAFSYTNPYDLNPGQTASFDVDVYFYKDKPDHSAVASYLLQVVDDY